MAEARGTRNRRPPFYEPTPADRPEATGHPELSSFSTKPTSVSRSEKANPTPHNGDKTRPNAKCSSEPSAYSSAEMDRMDHQMRIYPLTASTGYERISLNHSGPRNN